MKDTDGVSSQTERSNLPKNDFDKNLLQRKFSLSKASSTYWYGLNVIQGCELRVFFLTIGKPITQQCQKVQLVDTRQR